MRRTDAGDSGGRLGLNRAGGGERDSLLGRPGFAVAASALCALATAGLAPGWALAAAPAVAVRGAVDKALRSEIEEAIGPAPSASASRLEARRRAREAGETAIAVLRSEGYYDYVVEPDIGDGDTPQAFVTVTPGPRSKIAQAHIEWVGPVPDPKVADAAQAAMQLKAGDPGRAADIIAAEGRIVAALQSRGFADATAQPRQVVVDHADFTVQPAFRIAAGELVHLGPVEVITRGRTNPKWVAHLAPWRVGEPYRPKSVAELERRLLDSGVYDRVTVSLAPADQAVNGQRPVIVSLADRPKGTLELGGSYSTDEGIGVDSRWILYNRLGRADTLTNIFRIAQIDSRLQSQLALPDWGRPEQTLKLTAALYRDDTPAYQLWGLGAAADLTHRFGKTSFLTYGVSLDATQTDQKEAEDFIALSKYRDLVTLGGLVAFAVDRSNDPLNPTTGWRLDARLEPKAAVGNGSVNYLKAQAQVSAYLPLGQTSGTVIAGRLKLGEIVGGDIPLVPAQDRFYAGGGGSVRGYGYQGVGPRFPDNNPEGGLSLFESSIEVRQRITQRWGVVGFVDAGSVGTNVAPDFSHPEVGVGVGVRYDLGFGPIRLDIATPLERREGDSPVQLYLSIGQSF
jgi:translocation and assembly module TamA